MTGQIETRQAQTDGVESPVRALAIVSDALNETIRQAHLELEDCVDGRGGAPALARAGELLHQARGALQVTETYGAALLTEEMELCCKYLVSLQDGKGREDGLDALTRAMVQLPVYIERLMGGGRDIALVLLPILNDLRAARGKPLLSEGTLLLLNLSPRTADGAASRGEGSGEEPVKVATRLRPKFQLALLGWIKGGESERHIATLAKVVAALEKSSTRDDMYQLWWVLGGVLEALQEGGLETSVALKRLLGQADRQVKHLISEGDAAFDSHPVDDLLNNLLYYVARSSTAGERISAIRSAFNLAELLPGDEQVENARDALSAPSTRLMNTVAAAIKEDLGRVKDVLDIFARTGMNKSAELVPQLELLKKISDTLGVLGLGELRSDIDGEIDRLKTVVERGGIADDQVVLDIASTLLRVEDRLDNQLLQLTAPQPWPDDSREPGVPAEEAAEFQQVAESVLRECIINLARIKETISQSVDSDAPSQGLDNIPTLIRGIQAGLMMLGKTRAMQIVDRIGKLITLILKFGGPSQLMQKDSDRLADAIVSIEYYMETVKAGRSEPWYMLDNAEACMSVLRDVQDRLEQLIKAEDGQPAAGASPLEKAAEGHVLQSGSMQATEVIPLPVVAANVDHIDPELLELFIEEAKEEVVSINRKLPAWSESLDDMDALITVRRSFHTLKGSGRMVGAERIAEYCWTIENLLNRLINQTLPRTQLMVDFILEATRAVPELIEQLEVGTQPEADITLLMARAHAFAEGNPDAAVLVLAPPTSDGVHAKAALEMDPVLLDIFSKETAGHLQVIEEYLESLDGHAPPFQVTDRLYRVCHTLHGSANMANVDRGVAVASALNRFVRRVYDLKLGFGPEGIGALDSAAKAIAVIVNDINKPDRDRADFSALIERLNVLTDAVEKLEPTEAGDGSAVALTSPWSRSEPEATTADEPPERLSVADDQQAAARAPEWAHEEAAEFDDDYDAEIAAIFTEESAELLEAADRAFDAWSHNKASRASIEELKRHLHTLKGGARMAGIAAMGNLSHEIEELLIAVVDERIDVSPVVENLLQQSIDELHRMRDTVMAGRPVKVAIELERRIRQTNAGLDQADIEVETGEGLAPAAESQPDGTADFGVETVALPWESLPEHAADADVEPGDEHWQPTETGFPESDAPESERAQDDASDFGIETIALPDQETDSSFAQNGFAPPDSPDAAEQAPDHEPDTEFESGDDHLQPDETGVAADHEFEPEVATAEPAYGDGYPADEAAELAGFGLSDDPGSMESEREVAPEAMPEHRDEADRIAAEEHDGWTADGGVPGDAVHAVPESGDAAFADDAPSSYETFQEDTAEPEETSADETADEQDASTEPARERRAAARAAAERQPFARVDASLLEDMMNAAGEISIYHSRLSQQVNSIEFHVEELEQTVSRLREQLRKLEIETEAQIMHGQQDTVVARDFDPLELDRYSNIQQLTRALAESAADLGSIKDLFNNLTTEAESLLIQQSRVTAELQDGLMRTRMVPFERYVGRLTRLVRQAAEESGKRAELAVEGASGELDRQVLEKMLPPFEHMLRNAVVHGLEMPEQRQGAGKPAVGRITIRLHREGTEMVVDVADDGRGLDVEAIRRKAYELELLTPDSKATDSEIMELILTPGFSTASEVTQTAGRGVGMDVVANEVKKLGGSLRISSVTGHGTNFTVRLPFTLAITQALIVRTGDEVYALPLPSVEGVARIARKDLENLMSQTEPTFQYGEQSYKFRHLGMYLGGQAATLPEDDAHVPVILVRAGEYSAALLTDEMLASREIVVKSVGPQLAGIRGISGATILGDGSIVLILDINALVRTGAPLVEIKSAAPTPKDTRPLALVVDDSITVRRVTERFLQRHGMRVLTAKDGLDAISVIQDNKPDIILLDIEMPRMDGYEFASHVRNDERFEDIPIVMITSRVGDKHRSRAIELGVNDYLGKPYQDTQLLEAIQRQLDDRGIELS